MKSWKATLVLLRQTFKDKGFVAKGTTFYRVADDGNWLVLSLQKSAKSDDVVSLFTWNYGVYSKRLLSRADGVELPQTWDPSNAHWRKRFSEAGREKWLHLPTTLAAEQAANELLAGIDDILTELAAHASDAALRDEWMTGAAPGLTAMQRLLYLAILLNEIGPSERLADTLSELRALVSKNGLSGMVEHRLAYAGVKSP